MSFEHFGDVFNLVLVRRCVTTSRHFNEEGIGEFVFPGLVCKCSDSLYRQALTIQRFFHIRSQMQRHPIVIYLSKAHLRVPPCVLNTPSSYFGVIFWGQLQKQPSLSPTIYSSNGFSNWKSSHSLIICLSLVDRSRISFLPSFLRRLPANDTSLPFGSLNFLS
jgi:hypothetical protein